MANAIHQGFFKKNIILYVNIISAAAIDVSSGTLIKRLHFVTLIEFCTIFQDSIVLITDLDSLAS